MTGCPEFSELLQKHLPNIKDTEEFNNTFKEETVNRFLIGQRSTVGSNATKAIEDIKNKETWKSWKDFFLERVVLIDVSDKYVFYELHLVFFTCSKKNFDSDTA